MKNSEQLIEFWLAPLIEAGMNWLFDYDRLIITWGGWQTFSWSGTVADASVWDVLSPSENEPFASVSVDNLTWNGDSLTFSWSFTVS
jgi:hypothetical protein